MADPFNFGEPEIVPAGDRLPSIPIDLRASGEIDHDHRPRGGFFFGLKGGMGLALGIVLVLAATGIGAWYGFKWWFRATVAEVKQDIDQAKAEKQKKADAYPLAVAGKGVLNIDGVRCEVKAAKLAGDSIIVTLTLSTKDRTKKYTHRAWAAHSLLEDRRATAKDEHGNKYTVIQGGDDPTIFTLDSESPITETLKIQKPVPGATSVYLALDGGDFKEGSVFKFDIPRSMWEAKP